MTDEKEEKWPILLVDDEEDIRDVLSVSAHMPSVAEMR